MSYSQEPSAHDSNADSPCLDVPTEFIELRLDKDDLPDLEIWKRHFRDDARQLAANGADRRKIFELLKNDFHRTTRSPQDWIRKYYSVAADAVEVALRERAEATGVKPNFEAPTAISFDELQAARKAPECFVEDLIFADARVIAAAGGTGKSTLTLLELATLAGGAETLYGRPVLRHGPVVFISGEDSREVIAARLREITADNGMLGKIATIIQRFFVADVSGSAFRLTTITNDIVVASDDVNRLIDSLQAIKPIAVVIDPLASFTVGEARTNDAEQAIIGVARQIRNALGCCVTLVHHVGKQNSREGAVDQYAFRGGSALADGARMVKILTRLDAAQWLKATGTDLAEDDQGIRLTVAKSTYVQKQDDIFLRRKGYHFEVVRLCGPTLAPEEIKESLVLELLRKEVAEGRFPTQNLLIGKGRTPLLPTMSKPAIRDTIENLTYKGLIERRPIPNRTGRGGARDYLHPIPARAVTPPAHQSEHARPFTPGFGAPGFGGPLRERIGSAAIAAAAPSDRWCADQQSITIGALNHQSDQGSTI